MQEEMLTLEKFEEASEIVKKVTLETKLHSNGIDTFYSSTNYNFGGNWGCFTSSGGLSL